MRSLEEIEKELIGLGYTAVADKSGEGFLRRGSSSLDIYSVSRRAVSFYYVDGYYKFIYFYNPDRVYNIVSNGYNYNIGNCEYNYCVGCDDMDVSSVILLYRGM